MPFQLTSEHRDNPFGIDGTIAVLGDGKNRLEVWPALGFNAIRWQVGAHELLHCPKSFFEENRPSRGGWPILFPFANRIRDGKYVWDGKSYSLPTNDSTKKNAIHGFAYTHPWRIIDQGATAGTAWLTGEFHGSKDAPESLALWPADYRIRLTYRLLDHVLRVEADVDNPDAKPLPFGLGYHPYFAIAPFGGPQSLVTVSASRRWELIDSLPSGKIVDLDEPRDLRPGKAYKDLQLDDVVTKLYTMAYDPQEALGLVGVVQHPGGQGMLTMWTSEDFREIVLFTPAHREAICLEPYTSTTDAINLQQGGVDAGLRVLQPGQRWQGIVEVHLAN